MREMSKIVRTMSGLVYGLILAFGFYVVVHGHLTPGGGFQGGAVLASAFAMLLVAFGRVNVHRHVPKHLFHVLEPLGALAFAALALLGIGTTVFFNVLANHDEAVLGNPVEFGVNPGYISTGGILPLMNIAVGIKVMAGLAVLVVVMAAAIHKKGGA